MVKKRKTLKQKARLAERRKQPVRVTSHKLPVEPIKMPQAVTVQNHSAATVDSADLRRSLKIVGMLIVGQLLIWALLHLTHIDNKIYDLIKI